MPINYDVEYPKLQQKCWQQQSEIERLGERLEIWPVDPETGEFLKNAEVLPTDCDGIACRDETIRQLEAEIERLTAEVTHYAQAYHREMVANKKLQAVVDAASSDLDKEAADEIERLKNELRACKSSCKWYVHEIATLKAEIERLRTDLELDKYAIGHYRDQIAKLQAVVDAAIAWANTDQNDIDECDKTNLELLDAVTEYEMSIAALKEADND